MYRHNHVYLVSDLSVLKEEHGPKSSMLSTRWSSRWIFTFCSSSGWQSFTVSTKSWQTERYSSTLSTLKERMYATLNTCRKQWFQVNTGY